ncbi:MAG: hypothetical protein WCG20_02315 [bacterium]
MEFNLKNYLKKFEKLLPYESRVRNAVIQAITDVLKIALVRQKITVSGSIVFIQGSSSLRSEIMMKQAKILNRIKEIDSSITITKIQ